MGDLLPLGFARLQSRCIADSLLTQLLCVTTVLTLQTALTGGPSREKPRAALLVRVYYLCNLNPINSKPTQSSSARRRQRRRKECVCVCVRGDEAAGEKRITPSFLSLYCEFSCPFCDIQQWLCSLLKAKAARLTFISSIPRRSQNVEKENPPLLLLFNLTFHSRRVTGGWQGITPRSVLLEMKTKTCLHASVVFFFWLSVPLSSVDTRTWPSHTEDIE